MGSVSWDHVSTNETPCHANGLSARVSDLYRSCGGEAHLSIPCQSLSSSLQTEYGQSARQADSQGERGLGHNVSAGYYSQYRIEMLEPGRTVLEEALDTEARVTEQAVRTLLGSFLFSGDSVFKRVEVLSGGEKSRLALVKLLLNPPNLLLMDEPTTHLDMSSIDALVAAMTQFEGTLVFISHDVHFIKTLANKVIHTAGGQLTPYLGDYEFYLHKTKAESARAALTAGGGAAAKAQGKADRPGSQKANKPRLNLQKQKKIVNKLEKEIDALESRKVAITGELELPETWSDGARSRSLGEELKTNTKRLAELSSKWEAEAARLELG
ncbi:MAG: ATP-binding cassette subfamily F protein 3 [Planctomycetota bacterium]|jgi:ATP-binding cassette subfamily F protein 3